MKLFVLAWSSYRDDLDSVDIKSELKEKYRVDTRRQDSFVQLGIYGALKLKQKCDISIDDELYLTSAVGNIEVLQRSNLRMRNDEFMKVYDFVNILGNSTNFYIAKILGTKAKSIFEISDNFSYINTLISVYASLCSSKKNAILGSIDLSTKPDEIIKRVLGVKENTKVVSSVNYQKLSLSDQGAIAEIEFDTVTYTLEEVKEILKKTDAEIVGSMRCDSLDLKKEKAFFQTQISYSINDAISLKKNMLYVDCFEDKYKIVKVNILI